MYLLIREEKGGTRVTLRFNVLAAATCLNFFYHPSRFAAVGPMGRFVGLFGVGLFPAMEACDVSVSVQFCIAAACVV